MIDAFKRCALVLLGTYLACLGLASCQSKEEQLAEDLEELAEELVLRKGESPVLRALRIQKAFRPMLPDELRVDGSLLPAGRHRREDVLSGLASLKGYPIASLRLNDLKVGLDAKERFARASGVAELSETDPSDLHAVKIPFDVQLGNSGGRFVLRRVWFGEARVDVPEARP